MGPVRTGDGGEEEGGEGRGDGGEEEGEERVEVQDCEEVGACGKDVCMGVEVGWAVVWGWCRL